jgi:hypothetical protein
LELLLALGFTVYSRAVLGHSPPKHKKGLWMGNLTWQKWIMLAKTGREFVLFFWGVPTSLRWQTMGAHIFRV